MKKTNESTVVKCNKNIFNIGDYKLSIVKVTSKGVTITIEGKEQGWKTNLFLYPEQATSLYETIREADIIKPEPQVKLMNVKVKHREYTRCDGELVFTYKYSEDNHAKLSITTAGGFVMISIYNNNKHFYTMNFKRDHKVSRELWDMKNKISFVYNETRIEMF